MSYNRFTSDGQRQRAASIQAMAGAQVDGHTAETSAADSSISIERPRLYLARAVIILRAASQNELADQYEAAAIRDFGEAEWRDDVHDAEQLEHPCPL
ncbi:hypothetical protein LTR78_002827 [Recurvomyces mirabilis]|uniref:Uncharacterized protein n=1 Tax=Recurvomyces mirabilis TaxID=574656 RepID=A0AAE1C3Y1_9PEZI|nr:hypothetical protein LTR78_002827 [Recurvomyces mirabilis]KAK5159440.1 hypothetical protein LTS14_002582 [Recurvomyces mirabilis]